MPMTGSSESKKMELGVPAVHVPTSKSANVQTVTSVPRPSSKRVENDGILRFDHDWILQDALVWFSKGMDKTLWKGLVPSNRCLHTLESLLVGCGWRPTPSKTGQDVKQGVAIVHNQWWREFVLETFSKCKHDVDSQVRRPILVIDAAKFRLGDRVENCIVFRLD